MQDAARYTSNKGAWWVRFFFALCGFFGESGLVRLAPFFYYPYLIWWSFFCPLVSVLVRVCGWDGG